MVDKIDGYLRKELETSLDEKQQEEGARGKLDIETGEWKYELTQKTLEKFDELVNLGFSEHSAYTILLEEFHRQFNKVVSPFGSLDLMGDYNLEEMSPKEITDHFRNRLEAALDKKQQEEGARGKLDIKTGEIEYSDTNRYLDEFDRLLADGKPVGLAYDKVTKNLPDSSSTPFGKTY